MKLVDHTRMEWNMVLEFIKGVERNKYIGYLLYPSPFICLFSG
jgi:hypothetical protein